MLVLSLHPVSLMGTPFFLATYLYTLNNFSYFSSYLKWFISLERRAYPLPYAGEAPFN
jgi:hypothetical protein